MEMPKLSNFIEKGYYINEKVILLVAAGFEDRDIAVIERFKSSSSQISKVIVLDYENYQDNEPVRSNVLNESKNISDNIEIIKIGELAKLSENLLLGHKIVVDITGMSRLLIFQVFNILDKVSCVYDVAYTEAEAYYPLKSFYDDLISGSTNKEVAFSKYLKRERAEIVYSYDCKIIQPKEFEGYPEPGKSAFLLAFFAFKRSRLQVILQNLELEKKVFVLSEPVRPELKWRKDLMEIVNFDLVKKNKPFVVTQNTLDPFQVMHFLEGKTYRNKDYSRYNLILAPLGSKMQTVGSYFYWRRHPEVSVVFSQPKSYFIHKYSKSYRDTFILSSDLILSETKLLHEYYAKSEAK